MGKLVCGSVSWFVMVLKITLARISFSGYAIGSSASSSLEDSSSTSNASNGNFSSGIFSTPSENNRQQINQIFTTFVPDDSCVVTGDFSEAPSLDGESPVQALVVSWPTSGNPLVVDGLDMVGGVYNVEKCNVVYQKQLKKERLHTERIKTWQKRGSFNLA